MSSLYTPNFDSVFLFFLIAVVIISYPCVCNKLKIYKRFQPLIYFFVERYIAEVPISAIAHPSLIFSAIYAERRFYAYGRVMTSKVSQTQAIL